MALKTNHFFPFVRMVRKLNIKNELKAFYGKIKDAKKSDDPKAVLAKLDDEEGIDFLFLFIEKLPDAENEVMDFLAVYTGLSREELEDMPIEETVGTIKRLLAEENFMGFFNSAVK